jgi:hypothetical protein
LDLSRLAYRRTATSGRRRRSLSVFTPEHPREPDDRIVAIAHALLAPLARADAEEAGRGGWTVDQMAGVRRASRETDAVAGLREVLAVVVDQNPLAGENIDELGLLAFSPAARAPMRGRSGSPV